MKRINPHIRLHCRGGVFLTRMWVCQGFACDGYLARGYGQSPVAAYYAWRDLAIIPF